MQQKRKPKIHLSKTTRSEIFIARVSLPVFIAVLILIQISLGRRTPHSTDEGIARLLDWATEKLRNWESRSAVSVGKMANDSRSNAGFHLQWPADFMPPELNFLSDVPDRLTQLKKAIALGKSRIRIHQVDNDKKTLVIEEPIDAAGQPFLRKKVIPLLPGEKLQVQAKAAATRVKQWTLRVRSAAVTQDRLDAPIPLLIGHSGTTPLQSEIDPNGHHFDIEIPTTAEFEKNKSTAFVIEWPINASGILLIDGLSPTGWGGSNKEPAVKNLIVQIDHMGHSLTRLTKTLSTIKNLSSEKQGTIHLTSAIPSSVDWTVSKETILSGKNPLELGVAIANRNIKQHIGKSNQFVKLAIKQGASARRITLNTTLSCEDSCSQNESPHGYGDDFTTTLAIHRSEEFESTEQLIRNDEFITQPGLLYAEITSPAHLLRLNVETKDTSQLPSYQWIYGGLMSAFGIRDMALQEEEKLSQLDHWLAKLMESFLVTSHAANIAIVLHDNSSPIQLGQDDVRSEIKRGEILLHLNELSETNKRQTEIHTFTKPVSSLTVMRAFGGRIFSSNNLRKIEDFFPQLESDSQSVSQLTTSQLITLTPSGWLIDPITPSNTKTSNYLAVAPPNKINEVQNVSNAERRLNRLLSVNIAFPPSNSDEEVIDIRIATSLTPVGCESDHENTQLKSFEKQSALSQHLLALSGRRSENSIWAIKCFLEGQITTPSNLKFRFSLNDTPLQREHFALGEYFHPIRGFLWHSPDSLELTGAQILDAMSVLSPPKIGAETREKVVVWADRFPAGLQSPRATITFQPELHATHNAPYGGPENTDQLSEKK